MGLSDDQRALLRLLAQREDGYEDIAALKGKSVAAVRDEVRAALAALDAPPPEPPPPPLLHRPRRHLPPRQNRAAARGEVVAPAPAAKPMAAGGPGAAAGRAGRASPPGRDRRRRAGDRRDRARRDRDLRRLRLGSDSGSGPAIAGSEISAEEEGKVTQAVLTAPDGGDAAGRAVFGRVGKKEVVLQVTAENLEPTGEGQSYTVWLYRTPKLSLRVGSVRSARRATSAPVSRSRPNCSPTSPAAPSTRSTISNRQR